MGRIRRRGTEAEKRRALAQRFITRGVSEGLSASAIIRTLTEAGLSYRRTEMLADIRAERGKEGIKGRGRYLRETAYPGPGTLDVSSFEIRTRYVYSFQIEFQHTETREVWTEYRSLGLERKYRRGELESIATDVFSFLTKLKDYKVKVRKATFMHGYAKTAEDIYR